MFWKALDGEVCDPISLQPICEFASEPFLLGKTYFDPEMLAHYLISTALFVHPTTREAISREDCVRLDRLLGGGGRKVAEAYDLLGNVNSRSRKESEAMRREAAQVFQQLFVFRSQRHRAPQQRKPRGGGGFTVVDDDEERFARQQQQNRLAFDLERDFPKLFEKPQLTRRLAPAVPRGGSSQLHGKILVAPVVVEDEVEEVEVVEEVEEEPSNEAEEEARARIEEAQFKEQLRLAKRQQQAKAKLPPPLPLPLPPQPAPTVVAPAIVPTLYPFWLLPLACLLLALAFTAATT